MTACVVVREFVKDEPASDNYREQMPETIEAFGGPFIARGSKLVIVDGR